MNCYFSNNNNISNNRNIPFRDQVASSNNKKINMLIETHTFLISTILYNPILSTFFIIKTQLQEQNKLILNSDLWQIIEQDKYV